MPVPTIAECTSYAARFKDLGHDPENSGRRSSVLLSISRSWAALAHQLENLTAIVEDERKK